MSEYKVKIYLAASWRNPYHASALAMLRSAGYEVYDFKNPVEGDTGFSWKEVDPNWKEWTAREMARALMSDRANEGFTHDLDALIWCDVGVLVLPSGMSAHLEAGWMAARDKRVLVFAPEIKEAELMYKLFDEDRVDATPIFDDMEDLIFSLDGFKDEYSEESRPKVRGYLYNDKPHHWR